MPTPPDDALLCSACGYDIGGLDHAGRCSECGLEVARSLPEARTGSPFQNSPTPTGWVLTLFRTLTAPRAVFNVVRIERPRCRGLLMLNLLIAAVLLSPGPWTDFARVFTRRPALAWGVNLVWGFLVLWSLTRIEERGIRLIGARRRWRVTRDVARAVTAHASVGWVVTGVLFLIAVTVPWPTFGLTLPPSLGVLNVNIAPVIPPVAALLIGLFVFELLVYLGVRRCSFANRPRATSGAAAGNDAPESRRDARA